MAEKKDYLIVGQGLAGTFFAFQLMRQKKSFMLVDQGLDSSSSKVAAGLINPVALRHLNLSWRASEFLSFNAGFYPKLEALLNKKYFFSLPIKKLIASEEEVHFWKHRYEKANLKGFIKKELSAEIDQNWNESIVKSGTVLSTAKLNVFQLLNDFRAFLLKNKLLIESSIQPQELVKYPFLEGIEFDKIVFCEGAYAKENPLFKHLPFALNKGQLMLIKAPFLKQNVILKKRAFILPHEKPEQYLLGATYARNWDHENPEAEKTALLKQQFAEISPKNFTLIEERCGIRPAVKDRRPLMGRSSLSDKCYIFNGLGSKACFIGPLLAQELFDHIEFNRPLHPESDIRRFEK